MNSFNRFLCQLSMVMAIALCTAGLGCGPTVTPEPLPFVPVSTGACCHGDGTCSDGVIEADCSAGGTFFANASCADVCAAPHDSSTQTPPPGVTIPGWYITGIASSIDDLSGTIGDQIKSQFNARPIASAAAQNLLTTVLNAGGAGQFEDAFVQVDTNHPGFGSATFFKLIDDHGEVQAYGLPAVELSTTGPLAQLQIPLRVQAHGPVIAIHRATVDSITSAIQQSIALFTTSSLFTNLPQSARTLFQHVMNDVSRFPSVPNASGLATFQSSYDLDVNSSAHLNLNFDMEVLRTSSNDRWLGAGSAFGQVTGSAQGLPQTLGVTIALGAQRLATPTVVNIEPGDAVVTAGERLDGVWTAPLSGQRLGLPAGPTGFARLVFDGTGQWTDVRIAASQTSAVPDESEFVSLKNALAELRMALADVGFDLPLEEFRTTMDAAGNVRLDFIVPDLASNSVHSLHDILTEYLSTATISDEARALLEELNGLLNGLNPILAPLPDLPAFSIVGIVSGNIIDGHLLVGPLWESATFTK